MHPNPVKILQEIHEDIDFFIQAFANGRSDIDIQPLDNKIRLFCSIIPLLPSAEAKKYKNSINEITQHLSDFISKLEQNRDILENKINSLNRHNAAHNAYGTALMLATQSTNAEE